MAEFDEGALAAERAQQEAEFQQAVENHPLTQLAKEAEQSAKEVRRQADEDAKAAERQAKEDAEKYPATTAAAEASQSRPAEEGDPGFVSAATGDAGPSGNAASVAPPGNAASKSDVSKSDVSSAPRPDASKSVNPKK